MFDAAALLHGTTSMEPEPAPKTPFWDCGSKRRRAEMEDAAN
jgi:hypothetical protein